MNRSRKAAPIAAAIGFGGLAFGLLIDPRTAFASYLVAWIVISAIPVGALAVLFTAYLVRAGWTHDLHDLLAGAALTIPIVALLFIPIAVGMAHVYPWASNEVHLTGFKAAYLTPWVFVLRSVSYFAIWTALAFWGARAYGSEAAMKRVASAGLIVWALTSSWAGIDWLESLEPEFHSSIYGLLMVSFQLLAGTRLRDRGSFTVPADPPDEQRSLRRDAALGAPALGLPARHAVHHHLDRQHSG